MKNYAYSTIAFFSLVCIQIGVGVIYKLAAGNKGYQFSQASALAIVSPTDVRASCLSSACRIRCTQGAISNQRHHLHSKKPMPVSELKSRTGSRLEWLCSPSLIYSTTISPSTCSASLILVRATNTGTINLVKSSSTFVTAVILWLLAGRITTQMQWVAIAIQVLGLISSQVR
jgi:hypothetical protein